jgi:hypothetical protein
MAAVLVFASWIFISLAFILVLRCAFLLDLPDWTVPVAGVSFVAAMMLNRAGQRLGGNS